VRACGENERKRMCERKSAGKCVCERERERDVRETRREREQIEKLIITVI
jgi:hypothetical protein